MVRWPGQIQPGTVSNEIVLAPGLAADLRSRRPATRTSRRSSTGYQAGDKTFKVHLDGYNLLPYLTGEVDRVAARSFFYSTTTAICRRCATTTGRSCSASSEPRSFKVWSEPFVKLRVPKIFNLRRDPFERADENSNSYWDWVLDHIFLLYPAQALAAEQLQSFRDFPPRQDPAAFNLDSVMKAVADAAGSGLH